jgi:hypothetical protein
MKDQEILKKLREVYQDCQQQAVVLSQHHPSLHHGFVADMQFASTYGAFLANIKMDHGVDLETESIASRLVSALEKNDTHAISQIRAEMYTALDEMKPEQYASYVFLSCFPSIYEAMK